MEVFQRDEIAELEDASGFRSDGLFVINGSEKLSSSLGYMIIFQAAL